MRIKLLWALEQLYIQKSDGGRISGRSDATNQSSRIYDKLDRGQQGNLYYSKIGGLKLEKLNKLEAEFLSGISFQLFVNENDYEQYESKLICVMIENDDDNKLSFLTQGALLEY